MTPSDLTLLKRRGLSVLRLDADDWQELLNSRQRGQRFTLVYPHGIARSAKSGSPVLIVIQGGASHGGDWDEPADVPNQLKLGWVRSIQAVATRDSRVSFDHVHDLTPDALKALCGVTAPPAIRSHVAAVVESTAPFDAFTPKSGEWVIDRIAARPENAIALRRLTALLTKQRRFHDAVALQEDAVALALKAFGASDASATELALSRGTTALEQARLREDAVIEHDARWIPGWTLSDSDLTGRAVFRQGDDQLHVFTANKQPLEELFGVDLIYLNERQQAIIMVQYKMMEEQERRSRKVETPYGSYAVREEPEWIVPINAKFREELERMERFVTATMGGGVYRMSHNPFFVKLVRRNGATGNAGILLSLDHLKLLMDAGDLTGPRGGLKISYGALGGHYLRGETFVDLVRSGYIGTHSATTEHFEALIKATLAGGRAVVAAIQSRLPMHD